MILPEFTCRERCSCCTIFVCFLLYALSTFFFFFFFFSPFSYGHCIVLPPSIYGFWLALMYLQTFLSLVLCFDERRADVCILLYCVHSIKLVFFDGFSSNLYIIFISIISQSCLKMTDIGILFEARSLFVN